MADRGLYPLHPNEKPFQARTYMFPLLPQVNAINYYAPLIFQDFNLAGNTTALLATGVVGILEFLFTIPAVLYVDHFGRKSILLAGALGMASCHFIVAGIIGAFGDNWQAHMGGGWAAVVFVWVFISFFAFSWGPVAWIIVSEVYPLSMRAKGVSLVSEDFMTRWDVTELTEYHREAASTG